MTMINFTNSNEVFPVIDLIRRELSKVGLYSSGDNLALVGKDKQEPNVVSVEVLREMTESPTLVTSVEYKYDNGTIEKMRLDRDDNLIIIGFLIEIELPTIVNSELEVEADINAFTAIYGTIVREEGLFKNLTLEYVKAV